MKIFSTLYGDNKIVQSVDTKEFDLTEYRQSILVNIYPDVEYSAFYGFGGALTESSAYCYSLLSDDEKSKFIESCYGQDGLGYKYARLHIDSCDFCLSNYCAKESEDSEFTLVRDEKYVLPLLRDIEKTQKLSYLMSPWSPPAYMKDSKDRNRGGKLLKEYYGAWAEHICTYIEKYIKMGFDIKYLTVQNEPIAAQKWDSCVYTAAEEADFLSNYLYAAMKARGLEEVKRLIWDHNRERMYERLRDIMAAVSDKESVSGVAYHWYRGDHFEQLRMVNEQYPDKLSVFSEGCVEYSHFGQGQATLHAEKYAYNILYCLKNGCNLFFDWNVLLDSEGGPNHVGNLCGAPIMLDADNKLKFCSSYYAIGHFSRYIKAGAKRIATSSFTDKLDNVAFKNPDGTLVMVLLNRRDENVLYNLRLGDTCAQFNMPAKSIYTIII